MHREAMRIEVGGTQADAVRETTVIEKVHRLQFNVTFDLLPLTTVDELRGVEASLYFSRRRHQNCVASTHTQSSLKL